MMSISRIEELIKNIGCYFVRRLYNEEYAWCAASMLSSYEMVNKDTPPPDAEKCSFSSKIGKNFGQTLLEKKIEIVKSRPL